MLAPVFKRLRAKRDMVGHFVFLAEQNGIDVAERFLRSAEDSFRDLAEHSAMGVGIPSRYENLAGMRKWRVKGFEQYLIFYLPRPNGVSIVRVLHAAQDWWRVFGIL